ncbi:MAG TPA: hypothetical protein VIX89_01455 [Bryobacteraceae bacterium]
MNKLALSILLSSLPFFAADETLPKADTVLDRYVEAVGGKAAIEKHRNEVMHGTIEVVGRGLKGTVTAYQAAPDKELLVIEFEGIGKIESGSNGEVAWERSAIQGPKVKDGVEKADALRDGTFNSLIYWRKLYTKVETTGAEKVEGHDCYKVVMTPKEGKPTTHFYDKESGLLVKTQATRITSAGEIAAEAFSEDYRKEGDMLVPHKLTNKVAGNELQILVTSLEFNADLPKNQFDLPDDIQALLKKAKPPEVKNVPPPAAAATGKPGKLTIYIAGSPAASETYSVQKSGGKIEVSGSGNATLGSMKIDIEQFKVVTDDKYQLIEAVAKAKLGQIQMNVKTTFADGKAKSDIDNGQGLKSREDIVHPDAIVVNQNLPLYPWSFLMMRAEMKNQDPQQFPVYVIGQSEVMASVVFKGKEPVEFVGKTVDLNHFKVDGATPQGQKVSLDFWVDDSRKVIKLAVPAQGVEGYQEGFERKAPPATPKGDSKGGKP